MADSFFEQYRILVQQAVTEQSAVLQKKKFEALHEVTEVQGELRGLQRALEMLKSVVDVD